MSPLRAFRRGSVRVLLVDDEAAGRALAEQLGRADFELDVAATVQQASALLARRAFDVVVAAYKLEGGSAIDVLEHAGEAFGVILAADCEEHVAARRYSNGSFEVIERCPALHRVLPKAIEDAFARKQRLGQLRTLSHALRCIADAVYVTGLDDEIVWVNRAFRETFGWSESEVVGKTSDLLWQSRKRPVTDLPGAPGEMLDWHLEATQVTKSGEALAVSLARSAVLDESGRAVAIVRVVRDVGEARAVEARLREANAELEMSRAALEQLNRHDELTGLFNRREAERLLRDELSRTARYGRPTSLILLDIDRFEELAAEHGRALCDEVLRRVAVVLKDGVRALDRPARFDRERFAVVLPETDAAGAKIAADRLRARIALSKAAARRGDGKQVPLAITVTAGIACAPADGIAGDDLFAAADRALQAAKPRPNRAA